MNFSETPEFQKDVKRLKKKWRSIPGDVDAVKQYILPLYENLAPDVSMEEYRRGFFASKKAAILLAGEGVEVVKMRLDVVDIAKSDKARIIFIAIKTKSTISFIELYSKNEKKREDATRIKKYLNNT